ncbi:MAG: hypothetical protein BWY78_01287 [Alphaproteobacteria bacterium ADurb.Bin438]|nr:MAG: hypothetical protein BWY78_01287 [Alphaproteobacteria bacterium ADurb.Bin438]
MKLLKLFSLCFIVMSCSVFGPEKSDISLYDENIKGDCDSMMREYQKALYERQGAMTELNYATYSMGRYGSSNVSIKELEAKFNKANNDVMHFEQEVLPLACPKNMFKR